MSVTLKPLGSLPETLTRAEWNVMRLWGLARIRSEKRRPGLDLLSVFLGRGVIPYGEGGGQVHKPATDLSDYQVVYPGDLVLNNQQAWRGSVGVSTHLGIVSPAYLVLALDDSLLNPPFANYLFQSRIMVDQFVTSSKGVGDIQRDIHVPWLRNVRVPIPSQEEQTAIVRFLDHTDHRFHRYLLASITLTGEIPARGGLLGEYRHRLIADVVAGRVDILDAAAALPEEESRPSLDQGPGGLDGTGEPWSAGAEPGSAEP